MSDFDKEAERERLREKYERDQRKREATEKMSDLLLKGATMTNAHCENCGDPIFRYEGQEFCPTCEEVVAEDAEGDARAAGDGDARSAGEASANGAAMDDAASEDDAGDAVDADATAATAADSTSGDPTGDDPTGDDATGDDASGETASGDARSEGQSATPDHIEIKRPAGSSGDADAGGSAASGDARTGPSANASGGSGAASPSPDASGGDAAVTAPSDAAGGGGITAARESLVRTLARQARQAEHCDDPRRARDHLAAAREAAEALSALSR